MIRIYEENKGWKLSFPSDFCPENSCERMVFGIENGRRSAMEHLEQKMQDEFSI